MCFKYQRKLQRPNEKNKIFLPVNENKISITFS